MKSQRGFTLIEVMIVLAIIAGVVVLGAPRLFKQNTNIKSVVRNLSVLTKETRNRARLSNTTYRIAFSIKLDESEYWVEKSSGPKPIDLEALKNPPREEDKDENAPPPPFTPDTSLMKKPKALPSGINLVSVESINISEPIKEGLAYIHFSPEGFVEASAVQISNAQNQIWTLVINPITGQADIVEKAVGLKDLNQ